MIELVDRLERATAIVSRRIALIGVAGMLFIALGTLTDVLMRWLFNQSLTGFNEVVEMGTAIAIAATFPAGAANRINLTVDILADRFGPRLSEWLKCLGALMLLILYIFLAWQVGVYADDLESRGATTVFLEWKQAPFMWGVTALLIIAATAQLIVVLTSVRAALETGANTSGAASSPSPLEDRRFAIWAFGLLSAGVLLVFLMKYGILAYARDLQTIPSTLAVVLFLVMWGMSLLLVPLSAAMALVGVLGSGLLMGIAPSLNVLGTEAASYLTNEQLAVLPMFLLMGSFAAAAGLSSDIYELAHVLLCHRRGGLALATIGGCAGFGALTGSSLATAATIGQVALPEMRARGYSLGLATGCVAAGGTLGQLVPPSTVIILYAILTEQSIGQLFIAAIVPAIIAVILYMITIALYVRIAPDAAPARQKRARLNEIIEAVRKAWGVLLLFALVIGGLYGGVFTINEAAAIGAIGAFLFALFRGKLSGGALWRVMGEVTRTTAMIYLLIFGAVTFSFFMGISGLPDLLGTLVTTLKLSPLGLIAVVLVIYIILGSIMDPFAVMVITIPIVTPLITKMGYDLVWWGIINVCVVETGLITPPFGINVFILKGIQGGEDVPMWTVFRGVLSFVAADLIKLTILVLFPVLSLWLPATMR